MKKLKIDILDFSYAMISMKNKIKEKIMLKKAYHHLLSVCVTMLLTLFAGTPNAAYAGETYSRPIYPDTTIVQDGQPAAWVVYPSGVAGYREMTEKIVSAVKAKTGAELKAIPDTEVTNAKYPVLLDAYRNRNLILLGRLGNNRAIWGVYNRFLCAVDGYYPGGDGYVVRTASNVYKNGANTIIAGGSSDKGAGRAVDKLVERIATQPFKDGRLSLPWLLDVELGGTCKEIFDNDERRQMARAFPGQSQHEDNPSRRFYENIMSYYWSGREAYLKLGLKYFDYVLREESYPLGGKQHSYHEHYATEFFARAYDMIDDSGLLSAEQIREADKAIMDTFYVYYGKGEREPLYRSGLQRGDALRPIDEIITADHQNSSWLADKVLADFILTTIPETSETASVYKEAGVRRDFYIKLFDALISERWRGCSPSPASTAGPSMTFFRYALEMERYDKFFDNGNARKSALYQLARVSPSGLDIGLFTSDLYASTEFGLLVGIAASYYHDGELKSVLAANSGRLAGHYGCYVNGVHTYRPGSEVLSVEPKSLTGAAYVPLEPALFRRMKSSLPYEKTFDYATIRSGFGVAADFLLLSGGNDLQANAIVKLSSGGRTCLSNATEDKTYDQNAVYVSCVSKPNTEVKAARALARLDNIASASEASYIRSVLPCYADADWIRQIVWLPGKFFVVFDKVSALEPGKYIVMANWRPNFYDVENRFGGLGPAVRGRLDGNRWVVKGDKTEFIMACTGKQIQLIEDAQVNAVNRLSTPVYRQRMVSELKRGESLAIPNLMFTRPAGAKQNYELRQTDEGGLLIRPTDENNSIYYVGPMPAPLGKSDAPMVVITTKGLTAFDSGNLEIFGKVWASNEPAKIREIDMDGAGVQEALTSLWSSSKISEPAVAAQENKPALKNGLVREWRYTGAQQPGQITGAKLTGANIWDLGYVADLSRISVKLASELSWDERSRGVRGSESGELGQILVSADGNADSYKPFIGELIDIAVPTIEGYAKITKKENVYQILRGAPQKARYVKVVGEQSPASCYMFYDADQPNESGDPMMARTVDIRDKNKPDILVYPNIWPGKRDVRRLSHSIFALDSYGHELWSHEMKWRIFFVRALDWAGTGLRKIFVGSLDNNIYVYDGNGKLEDTLTVENCINPLAANIGMWQPDSQGHSKLILPSYCHFSFLKNNGKFEGFAGCDDFYINNVLDKGLDYNGDGIEDNVAMSPSRLYFLSQKVIGGTAPRINLPASMESGSSGSPTLAFHLYAKGTTALFIARQNMLAIFDLKNQKWIIQWTPETPISAAVALPEQQQILCYTREGVLWRIKLNPDLAISGIENVPVSVEFNHFAVLDKKQGSVVATSKEGLFGIGMDNSLSLLANGSFVDADVYPSDSAAEKIIAVDKTGAVESYLLK